MNGKAPYAPCAGSQLVEKTPDQPAVVNHVTDCWVMLMAISARMIRTSSPAARQRTWNVRSPNGRRFVRGEADPAGMAGSAFVAMLTTANPSRRQSALSRCSCYEVIWLSCAVAIESMLDGSGA